MRNLLVLCLLLTLTASAIIGGKLLEKKVLLEKRALTEPEPLKESNLKKEENITLIIRTIGNTTKESFPASQSAGLSAIELLEKNHKIYYSGHLRCIDNVCSDRGYAWYFSVNNALGPDPRAYIPKRGDILLFEFRKWG